MPSAGACWHKGRTAADMESTPAITQKTDRKREGRLRELPPKPELEPEETYELSLTDLVENSGGRDGDGAGAGAVNQKRSASLDRDMGRRLSADKERNKSHSWRQRGERVMLNMYIPEAGRRSLSFRRSGERSAKVERNSSRRDEGPPATGFACWMGIGVWLGEKLPKAR